ncbi:cytOchrome o ubiquinol oxidase, subunit I domain protein, partial [Vibrio parahaemolyticus V-223/04]
CRRITTTKSLPRTA